MLNALDNLRALSRRLVALDDVSGSVVAACSGGADSLALVALVRAAGFDCTAAHVDHGLRPAGPAEAELVERFARSVGAGFESEQVGVRPGPNLEARARSARYAALEAVRERVGAEVLATGHTADDQAETILLDLLRGGALGALAGMPAARGRVRRPLLRLRRSDTVEVCARLGVASVDDPMNDDVTFRRVWVRRRLLPQLRATADRDVVPVLVRQSELAAADQELLDGLGREHLLGCGGVVGDPGSSPDAAFLVCAPVAVARRAVRCWLGPPWPNASDTERVLAVARGETERTEVAGAIVERGAGRLHVVALESHSSEPCPLPLPGHAGYGESRIDAWIDTAPPAVWPDGRSVCVVDADRVGTEAEVRPPRPGDRIRPLGMRGSKSVASVLADAGVPSRRRSQVPLVTAGDGSVIPAGEAMWVVGYRVDDRLRVSASTRRFLWLAVHDAQPREDS